MVGLGFLAMLDSRYFKLFLQYLHSYFVVHFQDSVADMVVALVWILHYKNGAILNIAAKVVVKLVNVLPSSVVQPYLLDLVHPLSSLLSLHQVEVSVSCATALNLILSNLSSKSEKAIWGILNKTETVAHIVSNIQDFSGGIIPSEYFQEMASLLSTILWRWPPSRYPVWSDVKLMKGLESIHTKPDLSVRVAVLKLYSALGMILIIVNFILFHLLVLKFVVYL
jgi:hypothetical protein